jgi:hypothetical protein
VVEEGVVLLHSLQVLEVQVDLVEDGAQGAEEVGQARVEAELQDQALQDLRLS